MAKDILLIKKKQVSPSTQNSIKKRIKRHLKDQATLNLLYSIDNSLTISKKRD